jgi:UDP-N-acetylmuramoyl-L-alanyl-D-glutamate--2,6-diaminopimelate ligase
MELIAASGADKPLAVIDYAHTPDALSKALGALREHCAGDAVVRVRCGGDRDPASDR